MTKTAFTNLLVGPVADTTGLDGTGKFTLQLARNNVPVPGKRGRGAESGAGERAGQGAGMPTLVAAASDSDSEQGAGRRGRRGAEPAAGYAPAPQTGCDSEYADGAPPVPPRRQRNKPWTQADYAQTYSAVLACGLQPGSARMSSAAASGTAAVGEADDNLCGGEEHAAHAEPMPAGMGTGKRRRRGDADTEGGAAQRKGNVCPHNCEKSQCKECGGSGLCPHQRRRSAGERESARTSASGAHARSAGGRASARTSAEGANARSAGGRASASTSARGAIARSAGGRASARTSEAGATARSAGGRASARTSAGGVSARSAGGRASARTSA